jgi:MFS family permease
MTQESVLKSSPAVRRLLGVGLVDYLGVGLFVAFSAVYFTRIVGLSTGSVGLGLGVAGLVALGAAVPIGRLGDRWGVRRTLVGLHVARALGTAGYAAVGEWWGFLAAVAVVTTADQSVAALTQAFVAELAHGSARVRTLAAYRTVANVGISLGAPIGGLAVGLDDSAAFRTVLLINAGAFLAVAALLTTIHPAHTQDPSPPEAGAHPPTIPGSTPTLGPAPAATSAPGSDAGPGRAPTSGAAPAGPPASAATSDPDPAPVFGPGAREPKASRGAALRDRRVWGLASIDTLLQLWLPVLNLGIPLWSAARGGFPAVWLGGLYAVNTVLAVALQVPAARIAASVRAARWCQVAAGVLLATACLVLWSARAGHPEVAFVVGMVLLSLGELVAVSAAWTLSYAIAPDDRRAEYLAAFGMGRSVGRYVLGPVLVTGLLQLVGGRTWGVLAALFVVAAVGTLFVRLPEGPARPDAPANPTARPGRLEVTSTAGAPRRTPPARIRRRPSRPGPG